MHAYKIIMIMVNLHIMIFVNVPVHTFTL